MSYATWTSSQITDLDRDKNDEGTKMIKAQMSAIARKNVIETIQLKLFRFH